MRAVKHARITVSLLAVVACTAATFTIGVALKAPCASGDWNDNRQYTKLCYSDIVPLLFTEQLVHNRLPFLNKCAAHPDSNCDEYPVLTMYFMRIAAWLSVGRTAPFYFVNAALLLLCAVLTAVCLAMLTGARALYFALAPTLLIYGTMNWDLLAVALATAAVLAFFRNRDGLSGGMLGLGAAAKAYPALFIVPFTLERIKRREPDRAILLLWVSLLTWFVVNLPFALVAPSSWYEFFRFNSHRPADFDSLWYMTCSRFNVCPSTHAINLMSVALFIGLVGIVWFAKSRIHPGFPVWTLGYPILVLFLLTNKVYSPQYGLWLLPWFALALPNIWAWAAFELADALVFVTRFRWFATYPALGWAWTRFEAAIWIRAFILVVTVVLWVVRAPEPLAIEKTASEEPADPADLVLEGPAPETAS
jgi:uncharacterized membrane protein